MDNRMKIRAAKALTLLTAYLLSTVGAACIALTCHCHHLHEHHHDTACRTVECCCGHDHDGHDAECERLTTGCGWLLAEKCCNHDHSTDTELYTADSDETAGLRMAAAQSDIAAGSRTEALAALLNGTGLAFAERRCPHAQKCRAVAVPLRAPPVCA